MNQFPNCNSDFSNIYFQYDSNNYHEQQPQTKACTKLTKDLAEQCQEIKCRSKKKLAQFEYEISFQSSILDSHVQAFQVFLQNYQNIARSWSQDLKFIKIQSKKLDLQSANQNKWFQEIINNCCHLSQAEKDQIALDWVKQKSLIKFLNIIFSGIQSQLIPQLIHLTKLTWEKYLSCFIFDFLDPEKVKNPQNFITQFTNQLQSSTYLPLLNLNNSVKNDKNLRLSFKQFIDCFSHTIYLVLEGYFENPYTSDQEQGEKRTRTYLSDQGTSIRQNREHYQQNLQKLNICRKYPRLQE